MPKPGFTVLTISIELDAKLEKLKRNTGAKSKQSLITSLVDGVLN